MSIVKLNNRSVKDVTSFGSISSLGSITHIATQTASSSASVSFTSGIDSTYKEYIFYFINMHPASNNVQFEFNMSIDGGSNYNVTKTTTLFKARLAENNTIQEFGYETSSDLAQSTNYQPFTYAGVRYDNDSSLSGVLRIFEPSSSTFVKHFISTCNYMSSSGSSPVSYNSFIGGYGNSTNSVDAIDFKMSSGNIDSGQILLFGLN